MKINKVEDNSQLLKNVMESQTGIIIFSLDKNYKYTTFTNLHKEVIKNIWNEDIELGMSILDVIKINEDKEKAKRNFDRVLNGESFILEEEYGEGENRMWWENRYSPVYNSNKDVVGITVFVIDITDRMLLNKKLESINKRYELILEGSDAGLWDWDIINKKVNFSSRWKSMRGFTDNEITDSEEEWSKNIHPDDFNDVMDSLNELFNSDQNYFQKEYRVKHKEGDYIWIIDKGKVLRDSEGNPVRMAGSEIDITQTKLDNQKIKESEERYKNYLLRSTEAFYRFELKKPMPLDLPIEEQVDYIYKHSSLAEYNPVYYDLYRRKNDETLYGKSIIELHGAEIDSYNFNTMKNFIESGFKSMGIEIPFINKEGKLIYTSNNSVGIIEDNKLIRIWGSQIDITEQKKSEIQNQTILKTSIDGFWLVDLKGKILDVNDSYCNLIGYIREELLTMQINDLELIENQKETKEHIKNIIAKGSDRFETRHRRKDGRVVDLEISVNYLNIDDGKLFVFLRDITARNKALQEIKTSEKRFHDIAESLADWIWEVDLEGRYTYASESVKNVLGYSAEEIIGMSAFDLLTDEDVEPIKKEFKELIKNKNAIKELPNINKHKNGKLIHIITNGIPILDEKNKIVGYRGVDKDITDKVLYEIELRESERKFREIFENGSDAIIIAEAKSGIIVDANKAAEKLVKLSKEELIGMHQTNLHPKEKDRFSKETFDYHQKALYKRESPEAIVNEIIQPDGTKVPVEVMASLIKYEGKDCLMGTFRNISERIKAEEALNNMQKLESIGTLAGGIAHDFNNLLSGIFGNIELAKIKSQNESVKIYLDKTIAALERAQNLTNQLLTFSKGGEPKKQIESINDLIIKAAEFALSGSNIKLKYKIQKDLHTCMIDKNQIMQVIDNLIINAKQAMPNGGEIFIKGENVTTKKILKQKLVPGKYIKIDIIDSGIGISEKNLSRIFDPFFTTKSTGHGLGLSTVYSIIKKHDGIIDVKSKLNKGTTFTIYLPVVEEKAIEQKPESKELHEGKGIFIILDDEKSIRDSVGDILENFGYEVEKKSMGEDVLEFFKGELAAGRKVSGMLFDLTIPGGLGGKETIGEIRKLCKETKVYVSSGYTDSDIMINPKNYGFNGKLLKPFRIKDLIELLNSDL